MNKLVFDEVRRAVSLHVLSSVLDDLMPNQGNKRLLRNWDVQDLPTEFVCNVKEGQKYVKKKKRTARQTTSARSYKSSKNRGTQVNSIRPNRSFTETSWQSGKDL